ncbi:MAG: SAM-dependent methyltransferase [Candidatus Hydrogenedentota bacterium]
MAGCAHKHDRADAAAIYTAAFLVSGAGIAFQIALTRIFSIAQWHHFAYMVVSIALMGFGISGALLACLRGRIRGWERRLLSGAVLLLAVSLPGCYALSQRIPFETLQLTTQQGEAWWLLALYLVLTAPFFLVSSAITLVFMLMPARIGRLYGVNMLGSGVGALAVVAGLFVLPPRLIPYALAVVVAAAFLALQWRGRFTRCAGLAVFAVSLGVFYAGPHAPVNVSEYKGLSYAMDLPDAQVEARRFSPLSVVTAVRAQQIRETPGQIANYSMAEHGRLPAQRGLYFDAGAVSPVHAFDGDLAPFTFLDHVTGALGYQMLDKPEVLVIGAGGGTEVLSALVHEARAVTAVEVDPSVFTLMQGPLHDFSGSLYSHPKVTPVLADGRGYLEAHSERRFDLVQIALLDSFGAAAAGVHALSENYLYTREALALGLERLTDNGVLCLTRWLKTPPRDALKLFAAAVEACETVGITEPARHMAFIRSWNTGTIAVSKAPLTGTQIKAIRGFCEKRGFDLCYLPGMAPAEANRYTQLEEASYHHFATAVLSDNRQRAYDEAFFAVHPATDDRPFHFQFFKWRSLPWFVKYAGQHGMPFIEWGYIVLLATLVQSIIVSVVLILGPLLFLRRGVPPAARKGKRWVVAYFAALGLGYIFLELAFMQRFILFLAYPVYAVAVVLAALLAFSGLGSFYADRFRHRRARTLLAVVIAITALALLYIHALPGVFQALAGLSDPAKITVSIALLAPVAFLMGMPFPLGLQLVSDRREALVPWVWGINGCFSVVATSLAMLIAVHGGFSILLYAAVAIYFAAVVSMMRMEKKLGST